MKQRVTLYIEADLWRQFRATCVQRGYSASQIADALIREQMSAWLLEPNNSQKDSHTPPATKKKR